MKEFLLYFLGQGETQEFALFTPAHFAPVVMAAGVIYVLFRSREKLRVWQHEEKLRYLMAFALIITDMSYYWRLAAMPSLGGNAMNDLPIGVCTWSVILGSFMMVGKNQTLFDIIYFWLLSGSLFALITPTPLTYTGPTRYRYYQFWLEHTLGYISLFYLIFVHNMRPTVRSAVKSWIALAVLAVFSYWVNTMIPGANYLYMARPEAAPSVLDILPANFALRTTIMALVVTAMFALAYLPWHLKDKKS